MSPDDGPSAQHHPFGLIELMSMFSQAAISIELEWNSPPCQIQIHLFTARSCFPASSTLTALDAGATWEWAETPQEESAIAVLQNATA